MIAEFLVLDDFRERDLVAWNELAGRAAEPNPFFEPSLLVPAVRHLGGGGSVRFLVVRDGSDFRFFAPFLPSRSRGYPRVLATWGHKYCFLRTPLVDRDPAAGATAWSTALRALERPVGGASLSELGTDGAVFEMLRAAMTPDEPVLHDVRPRAALRRRPAFDYFTGTMSGRHRRELHRRARKLEAATGGPVETVDVTDDPRALESFLELELGGWKGRAGTALASSTGDREFFVDACRGFLELGRLQIVALRTPKGYAAAIVCVRSDDMLFMVKMAYDETLREFSPGFRLVHDLVQIFHDDDRLAMMDSCADPRNEFINGLFPDRRATARVSVPSARRGTRVVVKTTQGATRAA